MPVPAGDTVQVILANLNLVVPVVAAVLVIIVAIIVICVLRGKGNYHKGKTLVPSLQVLYLQSETRPTWRCCSHGYQIGWIWILLYQLLRLLLWSLLGLLRFVLRSPEDRCFHLKHDYEMIVCETQCDQEFFFMQWFAIVCN